MDTLFMTKMAQQSSGKIKVFYLKNSVYLPKRNGSDILLLRKQNMKRKRKGNQRKSTLLLD